MSASFPTAPADSSSPSVTENGEVPASSEAVSSVPPEAQSVRKRTAPLSSASGVRAVKRQRPEPGAAVAGSSGSANGVHANGAADTSARAVTPKPEYGTTAQHFSVAPQTVQKASSALQEYMNDFMRTIEAHAEELPEPVVGAADGVIGSAMRLKRDLDGGADRDVIDVTLGTLQTFSDTVFRACGMIQDKTLADRIRMGIAPLDGAAAKIRRAL